MRTRLRSRREIERRLARYGYEEAVVGAVVARLAGQGFCDDGAFARAWLRERALLRPRGRRALRAELAARGVTPEDIDAALAEGFNEPEDDLARRALGSRLASFRANGNRRGRAALAAFLSRRGFARDVISRLDRETFGTR